VKKESYVRHRDLESRHFWFVGLHELALAHLPSGKNLRVLDAGCGTGGLLSLLSGRAEAVGIDFSEEALRLCRERGLQNTEQEDLNAWRPPSEAFDAITSLDVLCHRGVGSIEDVLKKFHTALKPGGLLIINLPAFEILRRGHDAEVETKRRFRKKELADLLDGAGFGIERITYRLPVLFPVLLVRGGTKQESRDLHMPPAFLNRALLGMHRLENRWICRGGTIPFGSSLFAAARKK
jgi:SAM-dependent methyltransferase